jgi:hypothetical protein
MAHHRSMLRTRALLLLPVGLLLTGCFQLEAPAPEPAAAQTEAVAPAMPTPDTFGPTARLEPECPPPTGRPLSATQLNTMMSRNQLPAWEAGDVGASAQLSDGRFFWVYGDTVRAPGFEGKPIVSNSVLVTSGTCTSQLLTDDSDNDPTVPETENGLSQWPMSVVRVPPSEAQAAEGITDVVVGFYARTQRGARQWDFIVRGTSMAVFLVGQDGVPRLSTISGLTPDEVDPTHIHWGAAATVDGDFLYVYGTRSTGVAEVYGRELYVSRLPVATPTDVETWEVWDGGRWQPEPERAAPIMDALGGVSQMLSVDRVDGRWLAVSKRGGDAEDNITVWSSDQPYGPWEARVVGSSPFQTEEGEIQYSPMAHPEIQTPSGALVVSVSRNHRDYERLHDEPELGRPYFVEVRLD